MVGTERDPRCCSVHSASGRLIHLDGQGRQGEDDIRAGGSDLGGIQYGNDSGAGLGPAEQI